jgi:FdhD protein
MNGLSRQAETVGVAETNIVKFDQAHPGGFHRRAAIIEERPLHIQVDEATYTLLRTPGRDRELVAGFLFTEGLIKNVNDIAILSQCPDFRDTITVRTNGIGDRPQRTLIMTSSCGMCGVENLDDILGALGRVDTCFEISPAELCRVSDAVRASQRLFALTGGAHAAASFGTDGRVMDVEEDVGRHNALDKLIGHALLHGLAIDNTGVFLSGRTSLELVVKAARAKIPLLASVGAPTGMAVDLADRLGITLCGFLRREETSVYTHGWRVAASELLREGDSASCRVIKNGQ